jgi:hypothetical protein
MEGAVRTPLTVKLSYDIDEMAVPEIISICGPEISDSRFARHNELLGSD